MGEMRALDHGTASVGHHMTVVFEGVPMGLESTAATGM